MKIAALQKTSPFWPHARNQNNLGLQVRHISSPNVPDLASGLSPSRPCFAISDSYGYLCATHSPEELIEILAYEEEFGPGALRRALTGASLVVHKKPDPKPPLSLEDLGL